MASLDYLLNNKRKRHIMGGILMSASLLFAGLAVTIVTLKQEEKENEDVDEGYIELNYYIYSWSCYWLCCNMESSEDQIRTDCSGRDRIC